MKHGQQVAEVGVPPLPTEARLHCAGFFVSWIVIDCRFYQWRSRTLPGSRRNVALHCWLPIGPVGDSINRYQTYLPNRPNVRPALSFRESCMTALNGNIPSGIQAKSLSLVTGTTRKSMCFTLVVLSTKSMRIKFHPHPSRHSSELPGSVFSHTLPDDALGFLRVR